MSAPAPVSEYQALHSSGWPSMKIRSCGTSTSSKTATASISSNRDASGSSNALPPLCNGARQ
jgi:hypothetical protein